MCSRFIFIPKDELNDIINAVKQNLKEQQYVNVAAPQTANAYDNAMVPILMPRQSQLETKVMHWGFQVPWNKEPIYNTRGDKAMALGNNMWKEAFQSRRCIIPTLGFYEPHKSEKTPSPKTGRPIKRQYLFQRAGTNLTFVAGIYENGDFSMMTTEPSEWMQDFHDRMPVVIDPGEFDQWLYGDDYPALLDRSSMKLVAQAAN